MQPLLKITDVAKALGVTDVTVLNWIKTAGFPAGRRLGGPRSRRVWLESDIDGWITRPVDVKPAKAAKRAPAAAQAT
jgi:predicted DNA-binding transcriptional regulator AlpA